MFRPYLICAHPFALSQVKRKDVRAEGFSLQKMLKEQILKVRGNSQRVVITRFRKVFNERLHASYAMEETGIYQELKKRQLYRLHAGKTKPDLRQCNAQFVEESVVDRTHLHHAPIYA